MKKVIIESGKFEKLSIARLSNLQLLMVKGGGSNPPGPGGPADPPTEPAPVPPTPGNQ